MEYIINVSEVEELQMTKSIADLETIFSRAKSIIVQGGIVILERQNADGSSYRFEEISTEEDLQKYHEKTFQYL